MTFLQSLNQYSVVLALLLAILFWVGLRAGYKNGGWNRNLVYLWTLIVYIQYILISPLNFFSNDKTTIIGTDISQYYGAGFFIGIVAVFCFIIGYWINNKKLSKWDEPPRFVYQNAHKVITILFWLIYGVVLINMAIGGINVTNIFLGSEQLGLGAKGATYYLQNFTDSLITLLIMAYLFKLPGRTLLIWTIASFFLFSLLGFRYRILLALFGFLFVYLYSNKLAIKQVFIGIFLILIFIYFTLFITINRYQLIQRDYNAMTYNPLEMKFEVIFDQTRGALADMAIYKLYDNPSKVQAAEHDYGASLFAYVFIRLMPRALLPNKDDFYPPPQIKIMWASYDAWWGKFSGEASLSVGATYIALGLAGVILFHFFWGLLLKRFQRNVRGKEELSFAISIVIVLVTFQWITRGYFPAAIDNVAYMLFPILLFNIFAKRVSLHADN